MHAVYLAAILPKIGPQVVAIHPEDILSEDEQIELSLKCMPIGGKEGDFSSVVFKDFQVTGYLTSTPPIDIKVEPRDTVVSIGFLIDVYSNPIPYRNLLMSFVNKFNTSDAFNLSSLEKILPEFLKFKSKNKISITLDGKEYCDLRLEKTEAEKEGLDLLDEALWG